MRRGELCDVALGAKRSAKIIGYILAHQRHKPFLLSRLLFVLGQVADSSDF